MTDPTHARRIGRRLALLLAAVLVVAGAVGTGIYLKTRGPSYPDEWDARVRPLVALVEKERGLDFEHPVHVDFLSDKAFREKVTTDGDELTAKERKEVEQTVGMMRALGVASGKLDLVKALNDLHGGGVIGLYSYEDKRIRLRGEKLTPAVRATLVHELTHALQDQHFDLEKRSAALKKKDDSSATAAWEALVEGDANRVESAYEKQLSKKQQDDLERDRDKGIDSTSDEIARVPEFLTTLMGSSYAFGEVLLALAIELDGNDRVDELFAEPPVTEEHLLDPWTLLTDDQAAVEVAEPRVRKGEKEFDSGIFGSPSWLLVLGERVDLHSALRATDGWGGDAYVAFERDGRSCVRVNYRGDSRRDLREMRTQLDRWVAAGPRGTARVNVAGQTLNFESCDPGEQAKAGRKASEEALALAVGRSWLAVGLKQAGAPAPFARCLAGRLAMTFDPADFSDPDFDAGTPAVQERIRAEAARCR